MSNNRKMANERDSLFKDPDAGLNEVFAQLESNYERVCEEIRRYKQLKNSKIEKLEASIRGKCDELATLNKQVQRLEKKFKKKDAVIKNLKEKFKEQSSQILDLKSRNQFHTRILQEMESHWNDVAIAIENRSDELDEWYNELSTAIDCFNKMKKLVQTTDDGNLDLSKALASVKEILDQEYVVEINSESGADTPTPGETQRRNIKINIRRLSNNGYTIRRPTSDSS